MSNAIRRVEERGFLREPVYRLAQAINASKGWRVTSGYRPCGPMSPTHSKGYSIDVAPLTYQRGGFWLNTAKRILDFAKRAMPNHEWATIAEADHVHISLANRSGFGINTKGRTVMYDPVTNKELRTTMGNESLQLDDMAWGDAIFGLGDAESGDALSGDALSGDALSGDFDEIGDASDTVGIIGDVRLLNAVANRRNQQLRKAVTKLPPKQRNAVEMAASIRKVQNQFSLPYEYCYNGIIRTSTTGDKKMGRREVTMIETAIFGMTPCAPRVFPLTYDGGTQTWWVDVSVSYYTMFQSTAPGDSVLYAGGIIIITANNLSMVPDTPATITRSIPQSGGRSPLINNTTLQLNAKKGGGASTRFFYVNAATVNARPQVTTPNLNAVAGPAVYPVPATNAYIYITNVPSTYNVSWVPFNPADTFTNDYLRNLPG